MTLAEIKLELSWLKRVISQNLVAGPDQEIAGPGADRSAEPLNYGTRKQLRFGSCSKMFGSH